MEEYFADYFSRHREEIDAVFFDADGTLSISGKPLPGALDFLTGLNRENFPYLLMTNDSSRSVEDKSGMQQKAGLPIGPEKIVSSGDALRLWNRPENGCWFCCGNLGTPDYASLAGICCTFDLEKLSGCCGVILGGGRYPWEIYINAVFDFFYHHREAPLVVANPDSFWPGAGGGTGMGVGSGGMARFLEALCRDAGFRLDITYLGKPYAPVYDYAIKILPERFPQLQNPVREKIVMLGDSLASDIRGGNRNGMITALVLTGITTPEQAALAENEFRPRLIFKGI